MQASSRGRPQLNTTSLPPALVNLNPELIFSIKPIGLSGEQRSLVILPFFFFMYYLFIIYLLAVLGLRFCARAFASCGKWGPLFIAVRGPLTVAASLVAEHRLQMRRLSSCGSRA